MRRWWIWRIRQGCSAVREVDAMTYTAALIRILEPTEIASRFTWARVAALADEYRRPAAWIARGLEACRRAGVDESYFIARYLRREAIAKDEGVDAAMREVAIEARQGKSQSVTCMGPLHPTAHYRAQNPGVWAARDSLKASTPSVFALELMF